ARGDALIPRPAAVLVVAGIGLSIAAGVLLLARAETRGADRSAERARSRALAWSGVQAMVTELAAQRGRILRGESLELEAQYVIEEDRTRLGVVRLLPVGSDGSRLVSEASKFDLAEASVESLEASGIVDGELAASVIAARDRFGGRLDSIEALLAAAPGEISAEDLFGPLEELDLRQAIAGEEADRGERILARLEGSVPRGLSDLLTVHAAEPSIDSEGRPRIPISPPWTDAMGEAITERLGEDAANVVRAVISGNLQGEGEALTRGLALARDRDLAEIMVRARVAIDDWIRPIDILSFESGEERTGRLDLNTASAAALRMLPGVTEDEASAIVDARERLTAQERATVMWPAMLEIWPIERYPELIERITVRSYLWRMRLACGTVDAESPDGPIEDATVWEVVVDLGSDRPRLAALREITQFDLAARLLAARLAADDSDRRRAEDGFEMDEFEEEGRSQGEVRDEDAFEGAAGAIPGSTAGAPPRPAWLDPIGPTRAEASRPAASSRSGRESSQGDAGTASPAGGVGSGTRQAPIGRWRPLR
ncbi:MAG: hypothetical protein ACO38W_09330, partial [Phycisphaerales bacterium]